MTRKIFSSQIKQKSKFALNRTLLAVVFAISVIVLGAIAFRYPGEISFKLGTEGVQLILDGSPQ